MGETFQLTPRALDAMEAFRASYATRSLTIVFTDLEAFTHLKAEVGEEKGLEVLNEHRTLVREELSRFAESQEIETAGDSFLIVFLRPSDAVMFVLRVLAVHRERRLVTADLPRVRIGVHAGEVSIIENVGPDQRKGLYGVQVDLASRVLGLAGGDQILLTRWVFDNARARVNGTEISGVGELAWMRHGFYRLKGVEDPFEICEVGECGVAAFESPASTETAHRMEEEEEILGWRPGLSSTVPGTNWVLEERLGRGGFGEVWVAHDRTMTQRRTVFKFCTRRGKIKSLRRELSVFNHLASSAGRTPPGIVEVRGTHDAEPPYYIELEYVAGGDLQQWIEREGKSAPLRIQLDLAIQMARALATVHGAGYVHRDIKPSNYLVAQSEDPSRAPGLKLSDFGVGQAALDDALAEARATVTQVHGETLLRAAGTFLYIAPELLRPSSNEDSETNAIAGRAETATDVYSLGVSLYQLFAGTLDAVPGPGLRMVEDPVLREDLSACLDEDPAERPTAGELVERFANHDKRLRAVTETERTRLEEEREKAVALAGALQAKRRAGRRALIAVSAALIVAVVFGLVSLAQRHAAVAARQDAEGLVEFMLTDLYDKLEPIGRLEILGDVTGKVLAYYDQFDTEKLSADLLRNRARALNNIGVILGAQGNPAQAMEHIDEAIAIIERLLEREPDNPTWLGDLADCLTSKGGVLGGDLTRDHESAAEVQRRAVALRERLAEAYPGDLSRQHDLAVSLQILTRHLKWFDPEGASEVITRGLSIAEQLNRLEPDNPDWLYNLVVLKTNAASHAPLPNGTSAEDGLREALDLRRRLVDSNPNDVRYISGLAWGYLGLGMRTEGEESVRSIRAAAEIFRDLSEQDPSNAGALITLGNMYFCLARALRGIGEHEGVIEVLRDELAVRENLVAMFPDDPGRLVLVLNIYSELSQSLIELGRHDEALEVCRAAFETHARNAELSPENAGVIHGWSRALVGMGRVQERLGDEEGARESWERAVEIIEPVTVGSEWGTVPVHILATHARALLHLGRVEEARPLVEELLERRWDNEEFLAHSREYGLHPWQADLETYRNELLAAADRASSKTTDVDLPPLQPLAEVLEAHWARMETEPEETSPRVRVRGVVTAAPLRLMKRGQFVLQDGNAGISIDDPALKGIINQTLEEGLQVEVAGSISDYHGMPNLEPDAPILILGREEAPSARRVFVSDFTTPTLGTLVDVGRVEILKTRVRIGQAYNHQAADEEGSEFILRVEDATGIPLVLATGDQLDLTGILTIFDGQYHVLPRSPADLRRYAPSAGRESSPVEEETSGAAP